MTSPPVRMARSSSIGFTAIAEAGGFHRRHLQAATQLVDHECGQRFAFHVLRDDQQRALACLHYGFEQRQHLLQAGELLFEQQDVRAVEFNGQLCQQLVMK